MEHSANQKYGLLAPLLLHGWLAEQGAELQQWFLKHGALHRCEMGEVLFTTGSEADGMYGVIAGALDIEYQPSSRDAALVVRAHPGSWIGQESLVSHLRRPITLTAPMQSRVCFVPRTSLMTLLAEQPVFWPAFFALAIRHTLEAGEFLCEALSLPPVTRLARLLLRLSEAHVDVAVSQRELGVMLGVPRTSLRRAITELSRAGIISTQYTRVMIHDRPRLELLASEV